MNIINQIVEVEGNKTAKNIRNVQSSLCKAKKWQLPPSFCYGNWDWGTQTRSETCRKPVIAYANENITYQTCHWRSPLAGWPLPNYIERRAELHSPVASSRSMAEGSLQSWTSTERRWWSSSYRPVFQTNLANAVTWQFKLQFTKCVRQCLSEWSELKTLFKPSAAQLTRPVTMTDRTIVIVIRVNITLVDYTLLWIAWFVL